MVTRAVLRHDVGGGEQRRPAPVARRAGRRRLSSARRARAAAGRQGRRRGKRSGAAFSGAGLGVEVDAGELADAVAGGQRAVRGAGLGRSCTAGIEGIGPDRLARYARQRRSRERLLEAARVDGGCSPSTPVGPRFRRADRRSRAGQRRTAAVKLRACGVDGAYRRQRRTPTPNRGPCSVARRAATTGPAPSLAAIRRSRRSRPRSGDQHADQRRRHAAESPTRMCTASEPRVQILCRRPVTSRSPRAIRALHTPDGGTLSAGPLPAMVALGDAG